MAAEDADGSAARGGQRRPGQAAPGHSPAAAQAPHSGGRRAGRAPELWFRAGHGGVPSKKIIKKKKKRAEGWKKE